MAPPKYKRDEVMHILAEIQSLLSEPEIPTSRGEEIVSKWSLLRDDYYARAEFIQAYDVHHGGSALQRKRERSEKCSERLDRYVNMFMSKARAFATHHEFTKTLGRAIWDLDKNDDDYEMKQSFLLWQWKVAMADIEGINKQCAKSKEKVDLWKTRARRASKKYEIGKRILEKGPLDFKEVHDEMSRVEKMLEEKLPREIWRSVEEGVSGLEEWRYWLVETEESDAGSWVVEEVIFSVPGLRGDGRSDSGAGRFSVSVDDS